MLITLRIANKTIYRVKVNSFIVRSNVIRFNGTYLTDNVNKMIPFINVVLPNTLSDSDTEEDEDLIPPTPTNTNLLTSTNLSIDTFTPTNTNLPTKTITVAELNLLLSTIKISNTINPTVDILKDKLLQQQREQDYIKQVLPYLKIGVTVQTYDGYRNKHDNFIVTSINTKSNAKNFKGKDSSGKEYNIPLIFIILPK